MTQEASEVIISAIGRLCTLVGQNYINLKSYINFLCRRTFMMLGLQQPASCSRTVYMTMRTDRPIQCVFFHCNLLVCVSLPFYCVFIAVISFYLVVSVSTKYLILYVLPVVFNKRLLQALAYRLYSMLCDKQLTAGDCGRLLPPNLHVLLDTVLKPSLSLLRNIPSKNSTSPRLGIAIPELFFQSRD